MSRQRIHPAPFAIASDGSLIANLHGYTGETDLRLFLQSAVEDERMIFIGTRLTAVEARTLLARLQGPRHEMTGFTLGARERRRLKKATRGARDR